MRAIGKFKDVQLIDPHRYAGATRASAQEAAENLLLANAVDLVVFLAQAQTATGLRRWVASIREVVAAEDHHVSSNEIFRAEPGSHAAPTGVPLRQQTLERLAAVGYSWPPTLQAAR